MLLGNYTTLSANPGRSVTHALPNPYKWRSSGNMYNFYTGMAVVTNVTDRSSYGNGYRPPYSWVLAPKQGGMASINNARGAGTLTGSGVSGLFATADLSGSGTISNAAAGLIVEMLATLAGSGSLSAGIVGQINAVATLAGTGNLSAVVSALAGLEATLIGSGAMTGAQQATGEMSASITVNQSQAQVSQIVEAVWNALAASFATAGTMGELLNGAGGGSSPSTIAAAVWNEGVPASYAPGTAGEKLGTIVNGISGTSALNSVATGYVLTTGIETNTYENTSRKDGITHTIDDVGNVIDGYYTFDIGVDGIPTGLGINANVQGNNDTVVVSYWDFVTSDWKIVCTILGTGNSALAQTDCILTAAAVGTGADSGKVRVRLSTASGATNPRLDVDLIYVSYAIVQRTIEFSGVLTGGGASTATLPLSASSIDDYYIPALMILTSGTGSGQSRRVDGYVGSTRVATLATPWATVPDATTTFSILPWGSVRVSDMDAPVLDAIADAVLDEPLSGHTTQGTVGKKIKDDLTKNQFLGLQ